ncbi:DnaJ domain-containing protein [Cryptosporidium serpentis]
MKQCHYSTLGVDIKASNEEIRQAYKKLSLLWHPDKNRDRVKEATRQFQLISAAYEVLSDPQERAWYDSHRKQILSGKEENEDVEDASTLNLWKYFSRDAFTEFDDSIEGFYSVYFNVFEEIVKDELFYVGKHSSEGQFWQNAPKFGTSKTDLNDVMIFYRFWSNFITNKSFGWKDLWNLTEAPNRQVRRAMEAENIKERKKAKKSFNETVRRLVDYIKKRDTRVIMYMHNKTEEMNRKIDLEKQKKKLEEIRRSELREQARLEEIRRMEELEKERKLAYGEFCESSDDLQSSAEEQIIYYCKPCNKTFKSEPQYNTHIKSKKHLSKVPKNETEISKPSPIKNIYKDYLHLKNTDLNYDSQSEYSEPSFRDSVKYLSNSLNKNKFEAKEVLDLIKNMNIDSSIIHESAENGGNIFQISSESEDKSKTNKKQRKKKDKNKDKSSSEKSCLKEDFSWKCLVCTSIFESRNKLFTHVKEMNHAAIKTNDITKKSKVKR